MQTSRTPGRPDAVRPIAALLLLTTFATGCHTCWPRATLTFRAVDATTRQPLAGVQAQRSSTGRTILEFPLFAGTEGTFPLPPSGDDGIIVADKLCRDLSHGFLFRRAGYLDAHAHWAQGDRVLVDLPPTDPHHGHQGQFASRRGPIDILMYPQGTPVVAYAPLWSPVPNAPPEIVDLAEQTCRREHPRQSTEWHNPPGARRAFKNQYGDYGIYWTAKHPKIGGSRWEWVQISADRSVCLYASGNSPASAEPTPQSLDFWSHH